MKSKTKQKAEVKGATTRKLTIAKAIAIEAKSLIVREVSKKDVHEIADYCWNRESDRVAAALTIRETKAKGRIWAAGSTSGTAEELIIAADFLYENNVELYKAYYAACIKSGLSKQFACVSTLKKATGRLKSIGRHMAHTADMMKMSQREYYKYTAKHAQ
jgi:hypothetical protein